MTDNEYTLSLLTSILLQNH